MENILVHPSGHIKITDFGLALENAIPWVIYTPICDTPNYMAPEVKMILYSLQMSAYFIWTLNLHYMKHYFT